MRSCGPALFEKRHFAAEIIVACVRWYLRFSLSLRDVEELMAERGLSVDHTTVWRWTQSYAPEVQRRLRGQLKLKGSTWHMDETFVRIAGRWMYLFRAVDSGGQTVDFYYRKLATVKPRSASSDEPWLIPTTAHRMCSLETDYEVIQRPFENCRTKVYSVAVVGIERDATRTIASNPTTVTSNGACGVCMDRGPWRRPARSLPESRRCR